MIITLEGDAGTGKSSFMYTAPLPIVTFAFDAGADRALYGAKWKNYEGIDIQIKTWPHDIYIDGTMNFSPEKLNAEQANWARNGGKAITIYLLPTPIQVSTKLVGMRQLWNAFTVMVVRAINAQEVATVGVDTMTIARRVAADAYLEQLQATPTGANRVQLLQIEYGKPNDQVRGVYSSAQNALEQYKAKGVQKHFIGTHHLDEVRQSVMDSKGEMQSIILMKGNQPIKKMEGLGNTDRFVDVQVRFNKGIQEPLPGVKMMGVEVEFLKCGLDMSLEGTKILNPTWDTMAAHLNKNLHPMAQVNQRGTLVEA